MNQVPPLASHHAQINCGTFARHLWKVTCTISRVRRGAFAAVLLSPPCFRLRRVHILFGTDRRKAISPPLYKKGSVLRAGGRLTGMARRHGHPPAGHPTVAPCRLHAVTLVRSRQRQLKKRKAFGCARIQEWQAIWQDLDAAAVSQGHVSMFQVPEEDVGCHSCPCTMVPLCALRPLCGSHARLTRPQCA